MSDYDDIGFLGGLFLLFMGACVVGGIIRALDSIPAPAPGPEPALREVTVTERIGDRVISERRVYLPAGQ